LGTARESFGTRLALRRTMPPRRSRQGTQLHVGVVSKNPDTLDGLQSYLRGAGVATSGTRRIAQSGKLCRVSSALIFFPDDFEWDAVVAALENCRRQRPSMLPVLVTQHPRRFEALAWPGDGALPLVVPKPAWGFTILDAIRTRLDGRQQEEEEE